MILNKLNTSSNANLAHNIYVTRLGLIFNYNIEYCPQ